ncbi:MAG: tRNA (adenosine(37)-N6)-threonylcarbamoyltransferase complex dimerization subunit type 1 TsaB [Lachnospiraceae bacterium]|nr:tRNA (adenosine(37)-N6)-threonylcarbamoyltransferase complex dimerization subunit type 1 TsaB [Lachnospiraceae bacterium]
MKILAIDSSGLTATVAVVDEAVVMASYTINYPHGYGGKKTHSQVLLPMIAEIAKTSGLELDSIDGIAVSGGPGSFTGLRIGSATAKGLGLALNKPLIHVPTLEAQAYQIYGYGGVICPIMDARRDQVYTGLYTFRQDAKQIVFEVMREQTALAIVDLIHLLNEIGEPVLFLGDGVPVHKEQLEKELEVAVSYAPVFLNRQNAAAVGALGMEYFKKGKIETAAQHAPDYLRVSQAERERSKLVDLARVEMQEMKNEDLSVIADLEKNIFPDGWNINGIAKFFAQPHVLSLTAKKAGQMIAYVFVAVMGEEAEVLHLAVIQSMRHQGVANRLMTKVVTLCREKGVKKLFLEVRESNEKARRFYEKYRFVQDGKRKDYYDEPKEDAVLMHLDI